MVQWDIMQLVCIAGYCQNVSFKTSFSEERYTEKVCFSNLFGGGGEGEREIILL